MVNKTQSVLFSNIKIKGNITTKESIIIYGKVTGNINAELVETFENSNIEGNITSKNTFIGGKFQVEGSIEHKTLSIKEGSVLRIKAEKKK